MNRIALFALLVLTALPLPAFAQNEPSQVPQVGTPKGVIPDRPSDDGLPETPFDWNSLPLEIRTTKEQLEAEAQEVYKSCSENGYQKKYYSCECVSGSFLQMRERVGPVPTMIFLMDKVLKSPEPSCANIPMIGISTLINCMKSSSRMNETAEDNKEFCECVAITTAKEFKKKPVPAPAYVQALKTYANNVCMDPVQRSAIVPAPKKTQEDPLGVKISP